MGKNHHCLIIETIAYQNIQVNYYQDEEEGMLWLKKEKFNTGNSKSSY